jgi:predicted transposase YbfD/YdcC
VLFSLLMLLTPKKTLFAIVDSGNHYLAAVKGNQPKLYELVQEQLVPHQTWFQVNKGHGRIEKRQVSIYHPPVGSFLDWPALATIIRVCSERQTKHKLETETRYYISDLTETAEELANRIRGYWGVENKVHYVRDVTFGEDKSRIRTTPLVQIWAIARNLAINLYRSAGFENMAQAQRKCQFGLKHLLSLFRMK